MEAFANTFRAHCSATVSNHLNPSPQHLTANCNIDSASVKSHSTSDGLVVTRVGVVATFRLGCTAGTTEPKLHGETDDGRYMVVSTSTQNKEFKQVSFLEETSQSKSRWVELRIYDDETYQKLLQARQSGSSESYYKPLKTISHGHYGVSGGPMFKMESVVALGLVAAFFFAHSFRSKIVN